jgi:4-aminobutyrate aminotransferase / (S)-3-amino-2-methylpropionate transaminase / 5-aminovalerate transaminase
MLKRLQGLQARYPSIGDVRGRRAMIAVELVQPGTMEPDPEQTLALAKACHADGVVVLTAGTFGNVLRFLPPLVMPEHLLTEALDIIEKAFAAQAR